jgi:hypothetical protein
MNTEVKFFEELLVRRKDNSFQFTPLARPCVMGGRRTTMTPRRLFGAEGCSRTPTSAPVDSSPIKWAPSASVPYCVYGTMTPEIRAEEPSPVPTPRSVPWRPWEDGCCHLPIVIVPSEWEN